MPQKVMLMGGFGQSKSLSSHLKDTLANDCGPEGQKIELDSSKLKYVVVGTNSHHIPSTNEPFQ
jgi:hypothetical protein